MIDIIDLTSLKDNNIAFPQKQQKKLARDISSSNDG